MPRIEAGELHVNYVEAGTGDAFLFIPGLMGLLEAWDFQLPHFSKRYCCITFDHRAQRKATSRRMPTRLT